MIEVEEKAARAVRKMVEVVDFMFVDLKLFLIDARLLSISAFLILIRVMMSGACDGILIGFWSLDFELLGVLKNDSWN